VGRVDEHIATGATAIATRRVLATAAVLACSMISGTLLALATPGIGSGVFAWVAFVPLLVALLLRPNDSVFLFALPCGLLWAFAGHSWFPDVLGDALGWFLVVAVGCLYAGLIEAGVSVLRRSPRWAAALAVSLAWASIEWLRSVAPVTRDWWFVSLAQTQWRFPAALQVLSVAGVAGLSFAIMLTNAGFSIAIVRWVQHRRLDTAALAAIALPASAVTIGAVSIANQPVPTLLVAATTDWMAGHPSAFESFEDRARATFDVNAELTRLTLGSDPSPDLVVWPESYAFDADDPVHITRLASFAREAGVHLVAHAMWPPEDGEGRRAGAILFGPGGSEIGRRAKIHIAPGEGSRPGPRTFEVFETGHAAIGLAACYDFHFTDVSRELARNGADVLVFPTDDNYRQGTRFPWIHASEAPLRAAEHRVAVVTATTSGVSVVCDPHGRVLAHGGVNGRSVITSGVFTSDRRTLYTRFGDWFGVLAVMLFAANIVIAIRGHRRSLAASADTQREAAAH
jgi:apolipoprotein N-acyltransferase